MSANSYLLVDAGNQRIKWRSDGVDASVEWLQGLPFQAPDWTAAGPALEAVVASVRSEEDSSKLAESLKHRGYETNFARVVPELEGLICGYLDCPQLGVDRWLAMLACWKKIQSGFVFVSAGTALTIDLVNDAGYHGGGYISAGLGLAREALLSRSEKLRRQYQERSSDLVPGKDTASAINNGCLLAVIESINGVRRRDDMADSQLVVSGGDAPILKSHIPDAILWTNVVLDGLSVWAETRPHER